MLIEDVLLVFAEALLAVLTATVWKFVVISYSGYHADRIPKGAVNVHEVLLYRFINNLLYNPILGLAKISFLITLLKLRSPNRFIIASLWALIVVNVLFIIAATLGNIFMCTPIHKRWNTSAPGTCGRQDQYIFGVVGVTIATDVLVTIIPAWIVYDLQMSIKSKIGIIAFLSLPLAVTAIGCYRLHQFVLVFSLPALTAEDPHNVRNALSNIESNLGVIAACGPTIKWILGRFISCFDTTQTASAYVPNPSARSGPGPRGYFKTSDDIELEAKVSGIKYSDGIRDSCFGKRSYDAESQEEILPGKAGRHIQKTTVMEWKSTYGSEAHELVIPSGTSHQSRS
ncbi:hypothetical protein NX059_005394 [Plenodomus lindquistii]|nr:hypothetical protein NX059_005394 [Plenodomus lindquistii]